MKLVHNPFRDLSRGEWALWLLSLLTVTLAYTFGGAGHFLYLIASLIGVSALIFVSKGYVIGQALTVVFALLYGIVSFWFSYYGEMITYLCMTAPIAVCAVVSWARHPFRDTPVVTVRRMTARHCVWMWVLAGAVTACFFFILRALGTAQLAISTLSVTTSFLASYLTWARSPFYAVAYAANDLVLIALWSIAALTDPASFSMTFCFLAFLANDLYGFFHWRRLEREQTKK